MRSAKGRRTRTSLIVLVGTVSHRRSQVYIRPRSSTVSPVPYFLLLKLADVRARAAKMCGGARTRPEGVLLDRHAFHATVH